VGIHFQQFRIDFGKKFVPDFMINGTMYKIENCKNYNGNHSPYQILLGNTADFVDNNFNILSIRTINTEVNVENTLDMLSGCKF